MVMGEFTQDVEVLVLGGGPGGYAAAFRAADLGHEVTLIDMDGRAGGVCLFRGCIPSKALLHAAGLLQEVQAADQMGIRFGRPEIDLDALRKWKTAVVEKLAGGLAGLCRQRGVEVIKARAGFEDSRHVRLYESDSEITHIQFRHAIIATGSRAVPLPGMEFKKDGRIWDSTLALELREIPERLLIVGGGYVGVEMGSVYAAFGSRVTLVEMTAGLMPAVDADLLKPLQDRLKGLFEAIHLNTRVEKFEERADRVAVVFKGPDGSSEHSFDNVLVAVGRRPHSDGLGLENTAVELDERGFIKVDDQRRTHDRQIYAIGDVVGGVMLAHKAMYEGKIAAEAIDGQPAAFEPQAIPAVVYSEPQVAWCGLTETEARARNIAVKIVRYPWSASGRAATLGLSKGMTKMVLEPESGRILGMGIVGSEAGELIAEGVLAIEMGALAEDVALSIHPHPTLSEGDEEAAEVFLGSATHLFAGRK